MSRSERCLRGFSFVLLICGASEVFCQGLIEIDALNGKAWELVFTHPMESRQYTMQAKEWAEKINYLPGLGDAYSTLGYLYCVEGAYADGYQYYNESLRVRRASGDSAKVANVFINLSIFKNGEGLYDDARRNATNAISILETLIKKEPSGGDSYNKKAYSLGQAYLNLSNIYSDFHDNILALEYARKGYKIILSTKNKLWQVRAMHTLANRFYTAWEPKESRKDYADSAKFYYQSTLEYFLHPTQADEALVSSQEIAAIYYNIAQIDLDQGNYHNAWELLNQSEAVYQGIEADADREAGLFYVWMSRGQWQFDFKKDYKTALEFFRKASQTKEMEAVDVSARLELLNQISETFANIGQQDSAYHYKKMALSLSQAHFNDQQSRFQTGERNDWQEKLNSEIATSALVKERQKYLTVAIIALVLLAALIAVIAWIFVRAWRRKAKAADEQIQHLVGSLDAKYLEGIESEREEIAALLHDDLGGQSVANTWMMEALIEQLPGGSDQQELAHRVLKNSQVLSESIRTFSHRLSSVYVRRSGLVPALQELCHDISKSGRILANITVGVGQEKLDVGQEIQLLRILQELITNTVKYAKAKVIDIQLSAVGPVFEMRYSDDGVGFEIQKMLNVSTGLGLENVKRRVSVLNGTMLAESNPGSGMWVLVSFSLAPSSTNRV